MSEPGSLIRALSGRPAARNYHTYVTTEVGVGIASGRFPVGSILPNDAEMMNSYGVSRTVLREALKTLEAKGLVEARAKVGTRVLPKNRWNLFDRHVLSWIQAAGPDPALLVSLFQVRTVLECQAATLAATHRTTEQIRMLHYWLMQLRTVETMAEPFALAQFEIHRTIFEASRNPFLRAATGIPEFAVAQVVRSKQETGSVALTDECLCLYERLITSIEVRAPQEASQTMAAILQDEQRALAIG